MEATNPMALGGIIYTDISKDGKMAGPNFELTGKLVELSTHPITASGGCLLYTSDAADERSSVALGGRRIIEKKKNSLYSRSGSHHDLSM